ncbi:MAG: helix-turn-helix transcriptional regulator [Oscillospiraceae bacterium]|jgi:putative transcriptional regulator|nr:helix-turn-helix transcriptional regulator [Oscillospiraceae bacterium]
MTLKVVILRDWLLDLRGCRSQVEVAQEVGVSQQHISALEYGTKRPSPAVAKRLAKVLGFDWTRFYEDEDESAGQ